MLTDRSEINRVFAEQKSVTVPWWHSRTKLWAQNWSRLAVDARSATMSASHAAALSIAGQLCGGTGELRWKRFLRRASSGQERPVRRGLN